MKLSDHFTFDEFHPQSWQAERDPQIDDRIVELCEMIRASWGEPLTVTSGVRLKVENDLLVAQGKASPTSSHLKGLACDVYCASSWKRWKAINTLLANGVTRIGIARNFIHFDIDKDKAQHAIWTY